MLLILNNIGKIDLPKKFDNLFDRKGKFIISPTCSDNHYFEMAAETAWWALEYIETKENLFIEAYCERLLDAIFKRSQICDGILLHRASNGGLDTQLRSTNSVIRLFTNACYLNKRYKEKYSTFLEVITTYHFKFSFSLMGGKWFAHDTSEFNNDLPKLYIKRKNYNRNFIKDKHNTLTLNTHLDSLSTLAYIILKNNALSNKIEAENLFECGLKSLEEIMSIDCFNQDKIMSKLHRFYLKRRLSNKYKYSIFLIDRVIDPLLFKLFRPRMFFNDGYIARDVSTLNMHIDYFLVNIVDLLRLNAIANRLLKKNGNQFINKYQQYWNIISNAVNLVEANIDYKKKIFENNLQLAWYAEMHFLYAQFSDDYCHVVKELRDTGYFIENSFFNKSL